MNFLYVLFKNSFITTQRTNSVHDEDWSVTLFGVQLLCKEKVMQKI